MWKKYRCIFQKETQNDRSSFSLQTIKYGLIYLVGLICCVSCSQTQVYLTTKIEENGQTSNEMIVTVDRSFYAYNAQIFEMYKKRAENTRVVVEDYENGTKKGIRLIESVENYNTFVLENSTPSTKAEPRLLQISVLETPRLSDKLLHFKGDIDPSFFEKWGDVEFTYSIFVPGEIVAHNGTEVSKQNIIWEFTTKSESASIFVKWTQNQNTLLKWIIYISIAGINLCVWTFALRSPTIFQMSTRELCRHLIATFVVYVISVIAINHQIKNYISYFDSESVAFPLTSALFVVSISLMIYTNSIDRLFGPNLSNISRVSTTGVNYPVIATIPDGLRKIDYVHDNKNP